MKWLGVTVALLGASLCLIAWVYLRDRDTSDVRLYPIRVVRLHPATRAPSTSTSQRPGHRIVRGRRPS